MTVIDLTSDKEPDAPLVGMVTRFPPSESASATSAMELCRLLRRPHEYRVEVIRLLERGDEPADGHPVVMDLGARWHLCPDLAARRVNRCDVAVIQVDRHVPIESIGELMSKLEVPLILAVDEVGPENSEESRTMANLATNATATVVTSQTARRRLQAEVDDRTRIEVIPHGSRWAPFEPKVTSRCRILTWGFVSPGMGAERVVRTLPLLSDLEIPPRYRLVGAADPGWSRQEAALYRESLAALAERLGVGDQLEMVPVIHSEDDLRREIEHCDLIAVVYDSRDRASSRILTEAVSTGRPVVATAFPGAVELLSSGAGGLVAHDDDRAMADVIRAYLTDDETYLRTAQACAELSPGLSWETTARGYAALLARQFGRREHHVDARP